MSRNTIFASAAVAALVFVAAGAANAQQGGGGHGGGMLERYDGDKDGKISLVEYETGRQSMFSRIDADGNGALSFAELDDAAAKADGRMAQMMQSRIAAIKAGDTNGDQSISADEYKAVVDAEFAKLDANSDGFVTADELQAAMSAMGGH